MVGLRKPLFINKRFVLSAMFHQNLLNGPGIHKRKGKVARDEKRKKTMRIFLYIKYIANSEAFDGLEHFVEHKPPIYEE